MAAPLLLSSTTRHPPSCPLIATTPIRRGRGRRSTIAPSPSTQIRRRPLHFAVTTRLVISPSLFALPVHTSLIHSRCPLSKPIPPPCLPMAFRWTTHRTHRTSALHPLDGIAPSRPKVVQGDIPLRSNSLLPIQHSPKVCRVRRHRAAQGRSTISKHTPSIPLNGMYGGTTISSRSDVSSATAPIGSADPVRAHPR
jgi:hypothetical protein